MLSIALLALALAAVPLSRRLSDDYFSPAALVVAAWFGSLGLYALHLLPYPGMRPSTWAYILVTVTLLVAGALVGERFMPPAAGPRRRRVPRGAALWVSAFALLGILGTIWYVQEVRAHLGPDAFANPNAVRIALGQYEIPSRFLFLQLFCLAGPLLAIALHLGGVRLPWPAWTLVIVCALCTWITTDRTQFFLLTLTAFFMYVVNRGPRLGWTRLVAAVALCAVLLLANFTLVGIWVGKTSKNLGLTMRLPAPSTADSVPGSGSKEAQGAAPALAQTPPAGEAASPEHAPSVLQARLESLLQRTSPIYLYITGSYPALDVLMTAELGRTNGLHVAYPIVRLLQRAGVIAAELPPAIPEFRPLGMTSGSELRFNAYTFLYYPLMDFGPIGALGYVLAIGLLSGVVYGWVRRVRQAPLRLLMMGHVATALALSIFVNKFNNTAAWYIAVMTALPFIAGSLQDSPDNQA